MKKGSYYSNLIVLMGGCCSISPEQVDLPELPSNIVVVDDSSSDDLKEAFFTCLSDSFCGTTTSAGEPVLSWVVAATKEEAASIDHCKPLKEEPSAERKAFFKEFMKFLFINANKHRMCLALKNEQGEVVAGTICYPPNDRDLHNSFNGTCEFMRIVNELGGFSKMHPYWSVGRQAKAFHILGQTMAKGHHDAMNKQRHVYVCCFGTHPAHQGKGCGGILMAFLNTCADKWQVPSYLECNGVKNETFYGKHGYKEKKRMTIVLDGDAEFKPDGLEGMAAMVRPSASSISEAVGLLG